MRLIPVAISNWLMGRAATIHICMIQHLEKKLNYLVGKNMVSSAEDFIDLAATKSSMSGRAYEVRCPRGVQPASTWLKTELQRQRQLH
ncbi:hypothetical protein CUN63_26435 [Pseudomonas sp. ACM7]|nr:hypothetical protein CUN63_26435 [Pseudomonas sp. ACM7]